MRARVAFAGWAVIGGRWRTALGWAAVGSGWVLACSDGERELRLAAAPGPTPVFEDGSANAESGIATSSGGTSTSNTTSAGDTTGTTGWVIPADPGFFPTESIACGDGVRDPVREECDDGVGNGVDACTRDCQINDFLVDVWPGSDVPGDDAPVHRLGEGRHPIAAGDQSFAVTYIETDEGSAPTVKLARYTNPGHVIDRVVVSEGTTPSDHAHPTVAELPNGDFAVAWTDFGTDGDELGITMRKVGSGDRATCGRLYDRRDTVYSANLLRQLGPDGTWLASASWTLAGGATELAPPENVLAGLSTAARFTAPSVPDADARADLIIDLGAVWSVGALRQVYVDGAEPDSVSLAVSTNGTDWESVVTSEEPAGDDFEWLLYPPHEAQFLRLTMTGVTGASVDLRTLEIFPDSTVGQAVTSDMGLDVTSLSSVTVEASGWATSDSAASVIDGQVGGLAGRTEVGGATDDGVVTIDLGAEQLVRAVDLQFSGDTGWTNGGGIELSANQEEWVALAEASGSALEGGLYLTEEPVLARYVRVTNTFSEGAGQSTGRLDEIDVFTAACPEAHVSSPLFFAPQQDHSSQLSVDLLWTGTELVAAWQDFNDARTGPDLYLRRFDAELTPLDQDELLAGEPGPEGDVALAKFAGSWAAAWRHGQDDGLEAIRLRAGELEVTVAQVAPGAASDRPALAELDADHLLVVFTGGYSASPISSIESDQRLYGAVVEVDSESVTTFEIEPTVDPYTEADSRNQPNLMRVGGALYLTWRSSARLGDSSAEELWLKQLTWSASNSVPGLDLVEVPLPRWGSHRFGDQRLPALAGTTLFPMGGLLMAWEDWGPAFGSLQGKPDVAVQLAPTPLLRGEDKAVNCAETPCEAGQGPCTDETCAEGLVCRTDVGPKYNYGPDTPVCTPAHCVDGLLNGDETAIDCGESCGLCLTCPDLSELGRSGYCHPACPCEHGEADCEPTLNHADCAEGLICAANVGELWGYPSDEIDVCVKPHCVNNLLDEDEDRRDCGGVDCPGCDVGGAGYCTTDDPCSEGEGNCDNDDECVAPLVCADDVGFDYGFDADTNVCIPAACRDADPPLPPLNTEGHCTETCRCPTGVGECESDAECLGHHPLPSKNEARCAPEGLRYDLEAELDICMPAHCFDGLQNFAEIAIDCGGPCGSQCPVCPDTSDWASFEDPVRSWAVVESFRNAVPSVQDATDGQTSFHIASCGMTTLVSPLFDTGEWNIVGDELWIDVFVPEPSEDPWQGELRVDLQLLANGSTVGFTEIADLAELSPGEWNRVAFPVDEALTDLFLGVARGTLVLTFRLDDCEGEVDEPFLLDHVRFGGEARYRSVCATTVPSEPGDPTGGGLGGGSPGGGGTPGGGGPPGGGPGGAGNQPPGAFPDVLSFENLSQWSSAQTIDLVADTAQKTHLTQALSAPVSGYTLESAPFNAGQAGVDDVLLIDVLSTGPGIHAGTFTATLDCNGQLISYAPLSGSAFSAGCSASFNTLRLVAGMAVPAPPAGDCTLQLTPTVGGGATRLVLDHIRFEPLSVCDNAQYMLQATPTGIDPTQPDGSDADPYRICSRSQFDHVANPANAATLWNKHFELGVDLNLCSPADGSDTRTIGTNASKFIGVFDGRRHTLSGFRQTRTQTYTGLFQVVGAAGVVKDLRLRDVAISGAASTGAVVGDNHGLLSNVHVDSGTVTEGSSAVIEDVGGLVGYNRGVIEDCSAAVGVSVVSASDVGGLAGESRPSAGIFRSFATSPMTVQGTSGRAGGLIGRSYGEVVDSWASGDVTSTASTVGGLIGHARGSVRSSFATGSVSASGNYVGGLAGDAESADLKECWASGSVAGGTSVGGVLGRLTDGTIESCEADVNGEGVAETVSGVAHVGGLVGAVNGGVLSEVRAARPVTGTQLGVGGLVGHTTESVSVSNASAAGNVTCAQGSCGGLLGSGGDVDITDSFATGAVIASGNGSGGLAGSTGPSSLILRSYAAGTLVQGAQGVGGLVGNLEGDIVESFATANVHNTSGRGGGLVGRAYSTASIVDSYARGDVTGEDSGGLIGYLDASASVQRSYSSGSATAGGLIGTAVNSNAVTLALNHYNQEANPGFTAIGAATTGPLTVSGITGQTEAEMRKAASFVDWFDDDVWAINEDVSFPFHGTSQDPGFCQRETLVATAPFVSSLPVTPDGTEAHPYPICTPEQFQAIMAGDSTLRASHFVLMGDLDFSSVGTLEACNMGFSGTFDGNHRTITNFVCDTEGSAIASLFGTVQGTGVVRNLTLRDSYVFGRLRVAGLAGVNNGLIENVDLVNVTVAADYIAGLGGLGGVVGYNTGTVANVTAAVHVRAGADGRDAGGLIGRMQDGQVSNCVTSGSVERWDHVAGSDAGGLIGWLVAGSVSNSHSTANVISVATANGGLVGLAYGGASISQSSSSGSVYATAHSSGGLVGRSGALIDSSFSTGAVHGSGVVGGLVGYAAEASIIADSNASGTVLSALDIAGGLVGSGYGSISESHASGDVGGRRRVGGLVGELEETGVVESASALGEVTALEYDAGGLIGLARGTVTNSQASGAVRADGQVGGLIGQAANTARTLDSHALNVDVVGGYRVGGLAGYVTGLIQRCTSSTEDLNALGVVGTDSVGGLVGLGYGAIIDSRAALSVLGGGENVGGLVGRCFNGCTIVGSTSQGEVAGDGQYVGGLVGLADMTSAEATATVIVDSHASGSVVGRAWYVGGLVGSGRANIVRASASGSVLGSDYVGGLVGRLYETRASIEHSFATGGVQGSPGAALVGNLVGQGHGGTVAHSYATGSVIGKPSGGALVGGSTTSVYYVGNATDASANPGLSDVNPELASHAPAQLRQWVTFAGKNWNPYLWQIDEGNAPPHFVEPLEPDYCDEIPSDEATFEGHGSGTDADPYRICTEAQLQALADDPSLWASHFRLMRHLYASTITGSLGAPGTEFSGTFDGNHYALVRYGTVALALPTTELFGELSGTIRNLTLVRPTVSGASVGGLARRVLPGGELVNVHVVSGSVTSTSTSTGGLVALNDGNIRFGTSSALVTNGTATAAQILGGLVGHNSVSGIIEDSYAVGQVDRTGTAAGDWASGLVGWNYGLIDRAWSSARVVSTKNGVGGLVARNLGTINYGWALGNVTGVDRVGGLIGDQTASGILWRGRATGNVTATNNAGGLLGRNAGDVAESYTTSAVSTTSNYAGGLVGHLDGGSITDSRAGGTGTTSIPSTSGFRGGIAGQANGSARIWRTIGADITGSTNLGGVIGSATGSTFELAGNFWNSSKTPASLIVNGVPSITTGGAGRTTAQLMLEATFTSETPPENVANWDLDNVWSMTDTVSEPRLRWTDNPANCSSCPLEINTVLPNAGYYPGALEITVIGSGFDNTTTVTVGGAPCTNPTVVSDGMLRCLTPPGNVGLVDVVAYEGATEAIAANAFTYKAFTRADTLAGTGVAGSTNGAGNVAQFSSSINGFALRGSTLYVADGTNYKIRTIDLSELDPNNPQPANVTVGTLAGSGTLGTTDSTDGTGATAQFQQPDDLTFGPGNFLYVSDTDWVSGGLGEATVRQVNATTGETTTLLQGYYTASGIAIVEPYAYVADCDSAITRWELGTDEFSDFVGVSGTAGDIDGVGTAARMSCPYGLGLDPTRSFLYFSDWGNHKLKRVELATATVTTVAGTGTGGFVNGDALTTARFDLPNKIAVAPNHIFVADMLNCAVRQVNLATSQVTTIAGSPTTCARNDGLLATATFGTVTGIYYSPVYGLFVAAGNWGQGITGYVPTSVVTLIH